jgi:GNAT superfamily N-acetyltransferase
MQRSHEIKSLKLKDNREVYLRKLITTDAEMLFQYLCLLSAESRSRFGPHSFDKDTVNNICLHPQTDITRYIAISGERIVAYMLIQHGLIDADRKRYADKNIFFDETTTCTYAPSIADDYQNSGLGSVMFDSIINDLKAAGDKTVVLWGGVQATNARAVGFYTKYGFQHMGSFWHDEKDNYDMIKLL